jgi:hyaluronoglucosaminidase
MVDIYPKLKYVKILGEKIASNVELSIVKKSLGEFSEKASYISSELYNTESYGIIIEEEKAEIYYDSNRAFNYAILTLKELKMADELYISVIFDYPHMKIRGIIEGFYGQPWSFDERRSAIDTINKYKMNT